MHRAWYIGDIQRLIFGCLRPRDLVQVIRSSQVFSNVATDELWGTLNTFHALLSCLPPDFAERPLQRKDIQRLDFFLSKVQHLTLEGHSNENPLRLPRGFNRTKQDIGEERYKKSWKELWEEIAKIRPPLEMFRNLRTIRINYVVEELLRPLIGISGLQIAKIYIKHCLERQEDSVIRQILTGFQNVPNLEYLFIKDGRRGYITQDLIQKAPLNHLRLDSHKYTRNTAISEDIDFLVDVLQKSTLQHLTIHLDNGWSTPEIRALERKYLPSLKYLWLDLTKDKTVFCPSCPTNTSQPSSFSGWGCGCPPNGVIAGFPAKDLSQSPVTFLEGLDAPNLQLLNIKFPVYTTGKMLLDFVSAVKYNCRLNSLTELSLAGGGATHRLGRPANGSVTSRDLWTAIKVLLPLPRLKFLRISVVRGMLSVLDLNLYLSITEELSGLETIWLGCLQYSSMHPMFKFQHEPNPIPKYRWPEHIPLKNLAAFCSMLPNLVNVSVGSVTLDDTDTSSNPEFVCPNVKSIRILNWYHRTNYTALSGKQRIQMHNNVRKHFPNAKQELGLSDERYVFEDGKWNKSYDDRV